ncbi:MAG: hypothetical protein K2Y08_07945 [Alphaproteobacteria bacterium]|nr:hypothetical protein [Alphaproteobacteria bacterium]
MHRIKKILYPTLLASMLLTSAAHAVVPVFSFKGMTRHFKKGKKQFSPTIGMAALRSHLPENIRLYLGVIPGMDEKNRVYVADISQDPLAQITKILFPSVDGILGDRANDEMGNNFARYVTHPRTIALLMFYVEEVRAATASHLEAVAKSPKKKAALEGILKGNLRTLRQGHKKQARLGYVGQLHNSFGEKTSSSFNTNTLNPLLDAIERAVLIEEQEHADTSGSPRVSEASSSSASSSLTSSSASSSSSAASSSASAYSSSSAPPPQVPFYPHYAVEALISAFLDFHFDNQADLWTYMEEIQSIQKTLPEELAIIEDSFVKPDGQVFFEEQDLDIVLSKDKADLDMDDVFYLETLTELSGPTPYTNALSNGSAWRYDRAKDAFYIRTGSTNEQGAFTSLLETSKALERAPTLEKVGFIEGDHKHFADCGEMIVRHIFDLLTYNQFTKTFDLEALHKLPLTPYLQNLFDFFEVQQGLATASSGSEVIRSLWNRVVGDLNGLYPLLVKGVDDSPPCSSSNSPSQSAESISTPTPEIFIRYDNKRQKKEGVPSTYDLSTDFGNLINVFEKILGFGTTPYEGYDVKRWIQETFLKLFQTINPNHTYSVHFDQKKYQEDAWKDLLYGDLTVAVGNSFHFVINMQPGHGEITELKVRQEKPQEIQTQAKLKELLDDPEIIDLSSAQESFLSLLPNLTYPQETKMTPLSRLLRGPIEDNQRIVSLVYDLNTMDLSRFERHLPTLNLTLMNLLSDFDWEDDALMARISRSLYPLASKTDAFDEALKSVKRLKVDYEKSSHFINKFTGVTELDLTNLQDSHISFTQDFPFLETLVLPKSLVTLEGLEKAPNLKKLRIPYDCYKLKKLTFPVEMPFLEEFKLQRGMVVDGLEKLTGLKDLDYSGDVSETLMLPFLPSLEHLKTPSRLKEMPDLGQIPNLQVLDMHTAEMEQINFTHPHEHLRSFSPSFHVKEINGLENLPSLETIDLSQAGNLSNLIFTSDMPQIKTLSMKSYQKKLIGLGHLINLEDLESLVGLSNLTIDRPMEKLTHIGWPGFYNDFTYLEGIENLVRFTRLHLEQLKIKNLPIRADMLALEEITFPKTLERIEGVSHLRAVKKMDFRESALQEILFERDMPLLESLWLGKSFQRLEGGQYLSGLKELAIPIAALSNPAIKDLLPQLQTLRLTSGYEWDEPEMRVDLDEFPTNLTNLVLYGSKVTLKGNRTEWDRTPFYGSGDLPEPIKPGRRYFVDRFVKDRWE